VADRRRAGSRRLYASKGFRSSDSPTPRGPRTYRFIRREPDEDGNWGDLIIKRGLKRRARKRVLKINQESKSVLENLISQSKCRHVFSQPTHPDQKLQPWVLASEMGRLRKKLARDKIKIDSDAGLHTPRHTFLTEAGEHTDAFTLQYIAGHDTIKTTMRYVHPRAESVSRAFGRINQKKKPAESA
jgi:integrase